jgi:hypothetical protein
VDDEPLNEFAANDQVVQGGFSNAHLTVMEMLILAIFKALRICFIWDKVCAWARVPFQVDKYGTYCCSIMDGKLCTIYCNDSIAS